MSTSMPMVKTVEAARDHFLSASEGACTCEREDGVSQVCESFPQAQEFFEADTGSADEPDPEPEPPLEPQGGDTPPAEPADEETVIDPELSGAIVSSGAFTGFVLSCIQGRAWDRDTIGLMAEKACELGLGEIRDGRFVAHDTLPGE